MAPPRLLKSDGLTRPISRADLHELAVVYATELFARKGSVPATWLIAGGNRVVWVETPWEGDDEKSMSVAAITVAMKTVGAHAYSSIVEAWIATVPEDRPELAEVAPRHRDPKERDDILLVTTFDRKGAFNASRFLVTVRRHGPNFLGPRDDETFGGEHRMRGRMWNLFE